MNWKITNSKILVTGGAGFIGSNLCEELLAQNNDEVCLDNFITGKRENVEAFLSHPKFTLIEGDIRDLETCKIACEGRTIVLHQAALGSVPRSIENPFTTHEINTTGFLNMIMSAKDAKVKRFVYAASSSTYGDSTNLPKVEDVIGKPLSPYAITKYVNELYASVCADIYGMETIGLRYFNVFGRRQDPNGMYAAVIPKFIERFLDYESPVVNGGGDFSRDFTYIDNVIQANQRAATTTNSQAINTVYNVAYGAKTTIKELAESLRSGLAKHDPRIGDVEIKFGPIRIGDIPHSLASIDKAKSLLGYSPEYDVIEGLKLSIDWYWSNFRG